MDFFEQQDLARRRTGRLVWYFALAVVGIVVAVYLVAWFALAMAGGYAEEPGAVNPYANSLWQPELFLMVALGTLGVILLSSLYKTVQLSAGGEAVALMMGGRLIDSMTSDLTERRLLNVVEEMALASGTPVPPVYVMDQEPSINAFAAGREPSDAVIGVSRGCLEYLDRDELQGVMAHEFSHILNGDMRLNLRLIGILHGILVLAIIGWFVLRSMPFSGRSRGGKNSGGAIAVILVVGVGLLVVGSIGLLFGKLIKSAVSRQREYLADASAVQFTRLPDGIAGALKKIGGRCCCRRWRTWEGAMTPPSARPSPPAPPRWAVRRRVASPSAGAPSAPSAASTTPWRSSRGWRRRGCASSSPPAAPPWPTTASSAAPRASCCGRSPTPWAARYRRW
jgi:Zn-dependent protease with chaperone function